jgi:hypothetical protein
MSFAARMLGRLLMPASATVPALALAGGVCLAPALVVEAHASDEWQYSGWSDNTFDGAMFMGGTPPVTSRDLRLFGEVLGLDDMQMEIMRDAYEDLDRTYNREWTLFAERRSDEQHAVRAGGGWAEMQKRFLELKRDFDARVDRLEEQFTADLRLVLTPQQLDRWAALEREQRRTRTLAKYASYDEEKIDIVASVQAMELDDSLRAQLEPVLEEYRVQMDAALGARNRKAEQVGEEFTKVQQLEMDLQSETDPMVMQEGWQRMQQQREQLVPAGLELRRHSARVRDINIRYRDRVEQMLPPDKIDAFREITMPKPSSGMMFSGFSRVRMMLGMLENLDTMVAGAQMQMEMWGEAEGDELGAYLRRIRQVQPLSEDQSAEIEQIRAEWEAQSAAIRSRYAKGDSDPGEPDYISLPTPSGTLMLTRVSANDGFMGFPGQEIEDSDAHARQKEQSELDQRIIDRIRSILTIEQRGLFAMM